MDDLPVFLHTLPTMAFGFVLVIARVGTTLLVGPGLGETEIPATVRVALAVVLAALVFPLLQANLPPLPDSVPMLLSLIGIEILVGAWLGFMARMLVMALAMAGGMISFMVGLSSVLQIDPSLGTQVAALQRAMGLAAVALLFASGLYLLPVQAVMGNYEVIRRAATRTPAGRHNWSRVPSPTASAWRYAWRRPRHHLPGLFLQAALRLYQPSWCRIFRSMSSRPLPQILGKPRAIERRRRHYFRNTELTWECSKTFFRIAGPVEGAGQSGQRTGC